MAKGSMQFQNHRFKKESTYPLSADFGQQKKLLRTYHLDSEDPPSYGNYVNNYSLDPRLLRRGKERQPSHTVIN